MDAKREDWLQSELRFPPSGDAHHRQRQRMQGRSSGLDRLQDQEAAVGDGLADVGEADVGTPKDDVLDAKSESPVDLLSLGCSIGVSRSGSLASGLFFRLERMLDRHGIRSAIRAGLNKIALAVIFASRSENKTKPSPKSGGLDRYETVKMARAGPPSNGKEMGRRNCEMQKS